MVNSRIIVFAIALIFVIGTTAIPSVRADVGLPALYVVVSGSMIPRLNVGDLVVVERTDFNSIHPSDIIVYYADGLDIVHRVIAVTPEGLITKGDANPGPDEPSRWPPLGPSQVVGKVILTIPYAGLISIYFPPPLNYALIAMASLLVALAFRDDKKRDIREQGNPSTVENHD